MRDLFITCPHGFEALLEKELKDLGIAKVLPRFCGVLVPKTKENVFIANYLSRVATRVLWPIAEFHCSGREDLYANCSKVDWSLFLNPRKTFAIDANVHHPALKNSLFAALVVKDAICDHFRNKTGSRPSVDTQNPDMQLNLFIQKGKATLYLDTSGAPLHKRGWRVHQVEASIHESLAAALLLMSGYSKEKVFCDPFCGSGTFLIEAAWIATNTPPGILRKNWGFFRLPGFDMQEWKTWKDSQNAKRTSLPKGMIFGSDKSRETSGLCKEHLWKAGVSDCVELSYDPVAYYNLPTKPDLIVTNPPYGKRLEATHQLFKEFASFLQKSAASSTQVHMLAPESFSFEIEDFSPRSEFVFKNGGLPVKLLTLQ
jgi:putative N6-adenine-specific DNA methylase